MVSGIIGQLLWYQVV